MKIRMRAAAWMLGISLLSAMALPFPSAASQREAEPGGGAELTLKYEHPGMEFLLYRVAEEDGRLTEGFRDGDFGEKGYLPEQENNGDLQELTVALYQYVAQQETVPDHTGSMGKDEEEITLSGNGNLHNHWRCGAYAQSVSDKAKQRGKTVLRH